MWLQRLLRRTSLRAPSRPYIDLDPAILLYIIYLIGLFELGDRGQSAVVP
jgi:hypothetical protein